MLAPRALRTSFITAITLGRRRLFQMNTNAEMLLRLIHRYRVHSRFLLHAYVIMPDHVHLLVTPVADLSVERSMHLIKDGFTSYSSSSFPIWQDRLSSSRIDNPHSFAAAVHHIHTNPVRALLCLHPSDYLHSSAHPRAAVDPMPHYFASAAVQPAPPKLRPSQILKATLRGTPDAP